MSEEEKEKKNEKKEGKNKPKPNKDHDELVRGILSLPQLVKKLLIYALDNNLKRFINLDTLRPLSGDHIDKFLRVTHSDSVHACDMTPEALSEKGRLLKKIPQFRFVFIWEHKSAVQSLPIDFQVEGYNDSMMRMDFREEKESLSVVHSILIYHGKLLNLSMKRICLQKNYLTHIYECCMSTCKGVQN